jgi:hypothetical protein
MHGGTWFVRAPAGAPELFFVPDRPALGKHRCELELRGRAPLAGERGSRGPLPGPRLHAFNSAAHGDLNGSARVDTTSAAAAIETSTAEQQVSATVPGELIGSDLARQPIIARATRKLIDAVATEDTIASTPSQDIIRSPASTHHVVASAALNVVVACTCDDDVPTRRAN